MASQMSQSTQATQGEKALSGTPRTYTIAGVTVHFPTKAYPSQIAMMNHVIQGLKQKKNCLLESPTGSGKTLALLCAALAWQRHEAVRVAEFNAEIDARQEAALQSQKAQRKGGIQEASKGETSTPVKDATKSSSNISVTEDAADQPEKSSYFAKPTTTFELTDDEDEDFKPVKRTKSQLSDATNLDENNWPSTSFSSTTNQDDSNNPGPSSKVNDPKSDQPYFVPPEKRAMVPKIFFGTRTHKQITQITRELRKTYYKTVRSVVLASREHTCINPMLEGVPNKNEHCRELLDSASNLGDGCIYHVGARKFGSFNTLQHYGVVPGYDLEDLVKAGREAKSCPYYATRFLMANADIIFCPYNYIIDPNIRRSMNLELENQVLIFDEAHNMEDASREAASFTLKQPDIVKAMQDCEKVKNIGGAEPYALGETADLLSKFSIWIDKQNTNLRDLSHTTSGRCWTGTEVIASLDQFELSENKIRTCEGYFKAIMAQREKDIESMKERGLRLRLEKPSLSSASIMTIESVFRLFQEMYKNNGLNRDDFRVALIKATERRRRDGHSGPFHSALVLTVNVWCLNPALAFSAIRDAVHCIVLTSGTLSPMQSFESELGTPFPLKLEASHVIDRNQVWCGALGAGPNGVSLNGSYQNAESLAYQDEVGAVVQYVCDTMPYGVLCFFSSYRMMDKMVERWQITGRYRRLLAKKVVVMEPRSGASDFDNAMTEYYDAVNTDGEGYVGVKRGGLFLAVCRGKVSEGLDFSDNNARAVICVGIPFPNYRDMQIELKRDYNQKNVSRGLLPGADWYEIQAFRALNQALGRCIRHRRDWGAILLVDDRYVRNHRYIGSLSRWIRSSVRNCESFSSVPRSLISFRDEMLARPVPVDATFFVEPNILNTPSPSPLVVVRPAEPVYRGEAEHAMVTTLRVGMNISDIANGIQPQSQSLVSFADAFSSGCNRDIMDGNRVRPEPVINPSFPDPNFDVNLNPNPSNTQLPLNSSLTFSRRNRNSLTSTSSTRQPALPGSGIAAMFARQIEKQAKCGKLASQTSLDSGISEPPVRAKRERERKIRL